MYPIQNLKFYSNLVSKIAILISTHTWIQCQKLAKKCDSSVFCHRVLIGGISCTENTDGIDSVYQDFLQLRVHEMNQRGNPAFVRNKRLVSLDTGNVRQDYGHARLNVIVWRVEQLDQNRGGFGSCQSVTNLRVFRDVDDDGGGHWLEDFIVWTQQGHQGWDTPYSPTNKDVD